MDRKNGSVSCIAAKLWHYDEIRREMTAESEKVSHQNMHNGESGIIKGKHGGMVVSDYVVVCGPKKWQR